MRVIDADMFLADVSEIYEGSDWDEDEVHMSLADLRENMRRAEEYTDAVPVVRCKDCRFFQHGTTCTRFGIRMSRAHDDYCSYGGRKADAE